MHATSLPHAGMFSVAGLIVAAAAVSISLAAITSDDVADPRPTAHSSDGPIRTPPPFVYSASTSRVQSEFDPAIARRSADTIERWEPRASTATSPAIVPVPGGAPVVQSSTAGKESVDVECDWPTGSAVGRC